MIIIRRQLICAALEPRQLDHSVAPALAFDIYCQAMAWINQIRA